MRHRLLYLVAMLTALLPRRVQIALSGEPPIIVDGQQLDPQVQLLRALRRRRVRYGLVEPTVEAGRARYRREGAIFNPRPTSVGAVRDLEVAGMPARLYSPLERFRPGGWREGASLSGRRDAARPAGEDAGAPLTVYFHGGGFVIGDLDTHDEPCRMLCRHSGSHILSVAYRLAPEHPYPAAVKDAVAAYRWARANAALLGADPRRVAVGGDSAGANLAAVVTTLDMPFAQLLIYPPTDEWTDRPSRHLFDKRFFLSLSDHDAFRKHYAPEHHSLLDVEFKAPPAPALVVVAGFDILRDEVEAYATRLRASGGHTEVLRFPGLGHGFIHMTTVATAARRAVVEIAEAWRKLLGTG
jgi:acetyl esterase